MGAGPEYLLKNGLGEALTTEGRSAISTTLRPEGELLTEVATAFELNGLVSGQVRGAVSEGELPLVLSGNCNTSVGTLAGAGPEGLGILWFDAHADFNTPETTTTGFTDGMGLAIAVGHCWKAMAGAVPGFSPVPEENVVLAGIRDVDAAEKERLAASRITVVDAGSIEREGVRVLAEALDALRTRVGRIYVHLDLDVLDAKKVGRANVFASEGGLNAEDLEAALGLVRGRFEVAACGIASYDPTFDTNGRVMRTALSCVRVLTGHASRAS